MGRQGIVINPAEASHMLAIVKIRRKSTAKGLILSSIRAAVPIFSLSTPFFEYDVLYNLALDEMLCSFQL